MIYFVNYTKLHYLSPIIIIDPFYITKIAEMDIKLAIEFIFYIHIICALAEYCSKKYWNIYFITKYRVENITFVRLKKNDKIQHNTLHGHEIY